MTTVLDGTGEGSAKGILDTHARSWSGHWVRKPPPSLPTFQKSSVSAAKKTGTSPYQRAPCDCVELQTVCEMCCGEHLATNGRQIRLESFRAMTSKC